MKIRLPQSVYNPTSYAGAAIALIAVFMFVFLYVLASISSIDHAYTGIVIFIVIPVFIILGLLLIPIGMVRTIRRQKRTGKLPAEKFPILDLNQSRHRNATVLFAIGTTVFLFLSALGSYEAYHFTESVEFCGKVCHEVMHPEYIAYNKSPHAKVTCAECHVGEGANWYVKSKLSGLYQVYSAITHSYSKPIETPVRNLRPARETCEQCHWPQKTYGKQQRRAIYILPDEQNTKWEIDLLMNTGGGNPAFGNDSGIHWHINQDIEIEYITTDEKRSIIPQIILRDKITGKETIFHDEYEPFDADNAEFSERRVMDCIDCHNRPAHVYDDPSRFINVAIAAEAIPASLPFIKKAAVEACIQEYESTEEAMKGIRDYLTTFYEEEFAEKSLLSRDLEKAILGVQHAFSENIFPDMKVSWEHYPDNIGHMTSSGCFRCHDGKHTSEDGATISNECESCHMIMAQGPADSLVFASSMDGLPYRHPVDIDEAWMETGCYECHSTPPLDF
jgi:nitrate/TMAO reductase-like tetraheme cytochrome c subunit